MIVGTLVDGVGAKGRRSRALPIHDQLAGSEQGEYLEEGAGAKLLSLLCECLGHEKVGFSQEGFNAS